MPDLTPVLIGIDGGSTYSFGVAIDLKGRVLALSESGSLDFLAGDMAGARRNLSDLVKSLEMQLPTQNEFHRVIIGSQAVFVESSRDQNERLCRGILPVHATKLVGHSVIAFHGASLGTPSLLVFSGTGSTMIAENEDGATFQVGGWGPLFGDQGSAYWIAIECIQAAIAASEGRGPETALLNAIPEWFGVKDLADILPVAYQERHYRDKMAMLAQHLSDALGADDAVMTDICWRAGNQLARQALACLTPIQFKIRPIPVYLSGGVLTRNPLVRDAFLSVVRGRHDIEVREPRLPALLGAAALALREAGVSLDAATVNALETSFADVKARQAGPTPDSPPPKANPATS